MMRCESSAEVCGPKFMVPRHSRLTTRPSRPTWVVCMAMTASVSVSTDRLRQPDPGSRPAASSSEVRGGRAPEPPRPGRGRSIARMSEWVVALHVLIAFWFVAGLIGRDVTLAKARGTDDARLVHELAELAGRAAQAGGVVTPGLSAALRDRAVQIARTYELVTLVAIIALMVAKPF